MRIGMCGAGGSGKSSVLLKVANARGIPMLPSVARSVYARLGLKETDQYTMTPDQLWSLQNQILYARITAEAEMPDFISDRTLIDHLAYCLMRAHAGMPGDVTSSLIKAVFENMKAYHVVFFFPFKPEYVRDDGMRDTGIAFQYAMDAMMFGLLCQSGTRFAMVPDGSVEVRTAFVERAIQGLS